MNTKNKVLSTAKGNRFFNKKLFFGLCLVIFFTVHMSVATAESAPRIEWQKCLGGSEYDELRCIQQTSDGGYIVAGYSNSNDGNVAGNHGYYDCWIVKLDTDSNIVWQKSVGGPGDDEAYSIQQTSDGGYIVAGRSNYNFGTYKGGDVIGNHGGYDYWVVKLDTGGDIVWQKQLGGSGNDYAFSIQQTSDGGYIVAGLSYSNYVDVTENHGNGDYWVVKLDTGGNIVWQKSLGGLNYDYAYSIQQTSDGGYIVAGLSYSNDGDVTGNHGGYDYWVVKLDTSGNIVWQKSLGGSGDDEAYSIQQTSDGGYIVAGKSNSNDGNVTGNHGAFGSYGFYNSDDYWIVKLDSSGSIVWQKSLGGSGNDYAYSIQQASDGGYIVAGYSSNDYYIGDVISNVTGNHGGYDYWVVKLDTSGNIVWQKSLGGSVNDYAYSIQQTSDGDYIVAGASNSNDGDVTGNHVTGNYWYSGTADYWIVKLTQVPLADFSATPTYGTEPLKVSFTDLSTGTPTAWNWNFGDGSANSAMSNPKHTYLKAGNYTVTLTATNSAGSNTVTNSSYITVTAAPQPPVASFSSNVTFGNAPLNTAFTDTSTESPTSWYWDFGDSTYSTVKNPTHTYLAAGSYTVSLTVTNAARSNTATKSSYIKVATAPQPPVASFVTDTTSGNIPLVVRFADTSVSTIK